MAGKGILVLIILSVLQYCHTQEDDYCSKYYMGEEGEGVIYSDNYPFNYREGRQCQHKIFFRQSAARNRTICLTFHRFDLYDACWDHFLEFPAATRAKYCGSGHKFQDYNVVSALDNVFSPNFCWPVLNLVFDIKFQSTHITGNRGYYATFNVHEADPESYVPRPLSTPAPTPAPTAAPTPTPTPVPTTTSATPLPVQASEDSSLSDLPNGRDGERKKRQIACAVLSCPQYCNHGFKNDSNGCMTCECVASNQAPCSEDEYTCFDRGCIERSKLCDMIEDCADGSDENFIHARCSWVSQHVLEACSFEEDHCMLDAKGWQRDVRSHYGPRFDHTIGTLHSGHFMYSEFSQDTTSANLTATFDPFRSDQPRCLSFWYFMSGNVGGLDLYISVTGEDLEPVSMPVWYRKGHAGSQWFEAGVDLPPSAFPIHEIMFSSIKGRYGTDNIAIDDISFLNSTCAGDDHSCMFELGQCGWRHDEDGDIRWQRRKGPTGTAHTGPEGDAYTGDGYYLLMDASDHQSGQKARIISRPISNGHSGAKCLTFKYYMHGRYVNFLKVKGKHYDGTESIQWSQSGEQGESWQQAVVSLSAIEGPFQLIFEAVRGYNHLSDIAIDDVVIKDGYCNLEPEFTTTTTARYTPPPLTCNPGDWRCSDGQCIHGGLVCNGNYNCDDYSDEQNCGGQFLSMGVVIGITVCLILAVILVITIGLVVFRRKRLFRNSQGHRRPRPQLTPSCPPPPGDPIVCRTDTDPWLMNGRRFTCTEPPPPYTAVDNRGYDNGPQSPRVNLADLPDYNDVAASGSLPRYSSVQRPASDSPAPPPQSVSFSSGVIGPQSVGGEVPAGLRSGEHNQRPNLPTRPTLSGYGANTVTISFGSAYEPPPNYDISIIARRPEDGREGDGEREEREMAQREVPQQQQRQQQQRRRPSKEVTGAIPPPARNPSNHNVPSSHQSHNAPTSQAAAGRGGATAQKNLRVNLPSPGAAVSTDPRGCTQKNDNYRQRRDSSGSRSYDNADFNVYDNPGMSDTSSETSV